MKLVIWGVGRNGKRLFQILGADRVAAFIDSDASLQGTSHAGIPIISYQEYKRLYIQYLVIVSPKDSVKEILSVLQKDGIEWAFPMLEEELTQIVAFLKILPADYFMQKYNKMEMIYIYGFDPLGIVVYGYFKEKGYHCKMVIQNSLRGTVRQYIHEKMGVETETIENMLPMQKMILSMELEKYDRSMLNESWFVIETYYDLNEKNLYHNRKIENFKDRHKGERCFIVATGPSLKVEDLDILYHQHEVCISVNGIFKIFNDTRWRPDYYVISDYMGVCEWKEEILAMDVKYKFIADQAWCFQKEVQENIYKWHLQYGYEDGRRPQFSDDFAEKSFVGCTIVYEGALQLAVYMGFKEIYLLGADCRQISNKEAQHFVKEYSKVASYFQLDKMFLAYQSAKQYADSHGIKIYNATRGGDLEVFQRVDFDRLFLNYSVAEGD